MIVYVENPKHTAKKKKKKPVRITEFCKVSGSIYKNQLHLYMNEYQLTMNYQKEKLRK